MNLKTRLFKLEAIMCESERNRIRAMSDEELQAVYEELQAIVDSGPPEERALIAEEKAIIEAMTDEELKEVAAGASPSRWERIKETVKARMQGGPQATP